MALENMARGLLPFVVILISAAGQGITVDMRVFIDKSLCNFLNVQFTEALFKQFHQCLCTDTTQTCAATFSFADLHVMSTVDIKYSRANTGNSSLFDCRIYTNASDVVQCKRLEQCNTTNRFTSYYLPGSGSCTFSCIGFKWTYPEERLATTAPGFITLDQCTDHCSKTVGTSGTSTHRISTTTATTTTKPVTTASPETNTKTITTDNTSNTTTASESSARTSDDNTGVIIGVVVGVLAIVIIAIMVVIIFRQRRRLGKLENNNYGLNTSASVENIQNAELTHQNVNNSRELIRQSNLNISPPQDIPNVYEIICSDSHDVMVGSDTNVTTQHAQQCAGNEYLLPVEWRHGEYAEIIEYSYPDIDTKYSNNAYYNETENNTLSSAACDAESYGKKATENCEYENAAKKESL